MGCGEGSADKATGMSDHEGHLLGCDGLGCNDEVAFIFAGLGVEDYDEFALFCVILVISCGAP